MRARWIGSVEWSPLPLFTIGRLSGNIVVAPVDHHAMVLSPFYARMNSAPVQVYDSEGGVTRLPRQRFKGGGAELGYRYYFGRGGVRGLFLGASVIVARFTAQTQDSAEMSYLAYGGALDAGYQLIVGRGLSLSLGGGVEGLETSGPVLPLLFPAKTYADRGFLPRVLLSIGWAF